MSASMNRVWLIGNLGRDPEVRVTKDGNEVVTLAVATSEVWKDKGGERQEQTEWHRVVLFDGHADVAKKYLKKGSSVFIEGQNKTRKWVDSEGKDRYATEVVVGGRKGELKLLDKAPAKDAPFSDIE